MEISLADLQKLSGLAKLVREGAGETSQRQHVAEAAGEISRIMQRLQIDSTRRDREDLADQLFIRADALFETVQQIQAIEKQLAAAGVHMPERTPFVHLKDLDVDGLRDWIVRRKGNSEIGMRDPQERRDEAWLRDEARRR